MANPGAGHNVQNWKCEDGNQGGDRERKNFAGPIDRHQQNAEAAFRRLKSLLTPSNETKYCISLQEIQKSFTS